VLGVQHRTNYALREESQISGRNALQRVVYASTIYRQCIIIVKIYLV